MSKERVERLRHMAQMVHEVELARTARLGAAREATRARLGKLPASLPLTEEPALLAARQAHLHWAAAQRMQLNQRLAQETARLLEQRRKTARSLGRLEAVDKLCPYPPKR